MFAIEPIGHVRAHRTAADDDDWGDTVATIELVAAYGPESLAGLSEFSHVEVLYVFDRVDPARVTTGARHPRDNPAWPRVGIFAQRGKGRPNRLGTTICRVLGVDGTTLRVAEFDAIDGTPVVDLKPVMREFLPRSPVIQPAWSTELMASYWRIA
jgi:tRNA-Thr(GGU) m(6)t(6)A37 methyltransferase TsaA